MKRRTMSKPRKVEAGFSLVELLVAIVVTLIVTSAIYGLMASGENSFKRDPELTERQQNIRIAMDVIQRDIAGAGMGMNSFVQAFTDGLDNPLDSPFPSVINGGGQADYLELIGNDGLCPSVPTCGSPGDNIFTAAPLPPCFANAIPGFVYVQGSGGPANPDPAQNGGITPGLLWAEFPGGGGPPGCSGNANGHINFPGGQNPANPGGQAACCTNPPVPPANCNAFSTSQLCEQVSMVQVVRYEIAPDPANAAIPCLWRSPIGSLDSGGTVLGTKPPGNGWQMIARGIDDLQVQYLKGLPGGNGVPGINWDDTPGDVNSPDFSTIVQQVRVSLSARAFTLGQGGGTSTSGGAALAPVRGQLTSVTTPRAAMFALSLNDPDGAGGPQLPPWQ